MNKTRTELIDLILDHPDNKCSLKRLAYLETNLLEQFYFEL